MGLAQNLYRDAALGAGALGGAASMFWGGMSPMAKRTLIGAGIGAAYGGISSNHSVVGMGLLGAGLGRYGYQGARSLAMMSLHPQSSFGVGMRSLRGTAKMMAGLARRDGRAAGAFIGRTQMQASAGFNKFRGLFR